jgi:hypothetical protein
MAHYSNEVPSLILSRSPGFGMSIGVARGANVHTSGGREGDSTGALAKVLCHVFLP